MTARRLRRAGVRVAEDHKDSTRTYESTRVLARAST